MKHFHLSILLIGLVVIGCGSPSTQPHQATPSLPPLPIPKNSAVMLPPGSSCLVGQEVYSMLKSNILRRYKCEQFSIDKTETLGGDNVLFIDKDGRLLTGTIDEMWHVTVCGSSKKFVIWVTPNAKGGWFVGIGEKAQGKVVAP